MAELVWYHYWRAIYSATLQYDLDFFSYSSNFDCFVWNIDGSFCVRRNYQVWQIKSFKCIFFIIKVRQNYSLRYYHESSIFCWRNQKGNESNNIKHEDISLKAYNVSKIPKLYHLYIRSSRPFQDRSYIFPHFRLIKEYFQDHPYWKEAQNINLNLSTDEQCTISMIIHQFIFLKYPLLFGNNISLSEKQAIHTSLSCIFFLFCSFNSNNF
jgi:hypothetical protein